jgi:hypothetical protein
MQLLRTPSWSFSYATQKELEILSRNLLQSFIKMALKPVRPCATVELSFELKGMELYLLELPSSQSAKRRDKGPKAKGPKKKKSKCIWTPSTFPSRTALPGQNGHAGNVPGRNLFFYKAFQICPCLELWHEFVESSAQILSNRMICRFICPKIENRMICRINLPRH